MYKIVPFVLSVFQKTEECNNQDSEVVYVDQGLNTRNIMKAPTKKKKIFYTKMFWKSRERTNLRNNYNIKDV